MAQGGGAGVPENNVPVPEVPVALSGIPLESEFYGTWFGQLEGLDPQAAAIQFPSGSSLVRLELSPAESGAGVVGSVTFGSAAPPPAAQDPEASYPPGEPLRFPFLLAPTEGFVYDLSRTEAGIDGQFVVEWGSAQVFDSWCGLHTSDSCPGAHGGGRAVFYTEASEPQCGWVAGYQEEEREVSCATLGLCAVQRVCDCSTEPCVAAFFPGRLSLRLSQGHLAGAFAHVDFVNALGVPARAVRVNLRRAADDSATEPPPPVPAVGPEPQLVDQSAVEQLLFDHCEQCHLAPQALANIDYVTDVDELIRRGLIIPGDSGRSPLYYRMEQGNMPPSYIVERPTLEEIQFIADFIDAL